MDYYAVLDLKPDCTDDEIKARYRRLARECHPDVNPDDRAGATERLRRINEAYSALSNPAKRRRYDAKRAAGASAESKPPPPRRPYVYDRVGPMSAEQIYRAQRRQNGRNLILGVIVFFVVATVVYRTPPGTPAPWASPKTPAQPLIGTPPAAQSDAAPPIAPANTGTAQPASIVELRSTFDRVQPQIDLVLTRGINVRNELSRGPANSTDHDAVDRLVTDLDLLRSADDSLQSDMAALQTRAADPSLDSRASDELQEAVLAGRNVVRDIRELAPQPADPR